MKKKQQQTQEEEEEVVVVVVEITEVVVRIFFSRTFKTTYIYIEL